MESKRKIRSSGESLWSITMFFIWHCQPFLFLFQLLSIYTVMVLTMSNKQMSVLWFTVQTDKREFEYRRQQKR